MTAGELGEMLDKHEVYVCKAGQLVTSHTFCTQVISGELQGAATEADSMFR